MHQIRTAKFPLPTRSSAQMTPSPPDPGNKRPGPCSRTTLCAVWGRRSPDGSCFLFAPFSRQVEWETGASHFCLKNQWGLCTVCPPFLGFPLVCCTALSLSALVSFVL